MRSENIFWSFMVLLAGAAGQSIQYPFTSTCAVKGSTVTLPCSFTPLKSFFKDGGEIPLKIVRVLWCKNHLICQGPTPSVFDSNSTINNPRYEYLGDKERNCTLQIRDVSETDEETYRFRMEVNDTQGHFTNRTGMKVRVVEGTKMRIKSSSNVTEFIRGQSVSLQCTSLHCTFYHLNITWMKDGHTLSETGPALQLSSLTAEHSGNYTCAVRTNSWSQSEPFSLLVEGEKEEEPSKLPLILGAGFGFLLVLVIIILIFVKRKRAAAAGSQASAGGGKLMHDDNMYSSITHPAEDTGHQRTETSREDQDINYASVQFRNNQRNKQVEEAADSIIYSSVVTKG
ncbi:uncharacterized protein LOC106533522 [Austrofundulus limnaeus]|uniref:Uncharacterized protein LOC106533522 n=1 Tax=Austrofundulus limnaeus TaxID=52670 RepID=A0A2I4CZ97_AUSLI|nr:PREDICTED: uncharacterized protein LOC106533522 [Austrofundulus limnaeus]